MDLHKLRKIPLTIYISEIAQSLVIYPLILFMDSINDWLSKKKWHCWIAKYFQESRKLWWIWNIVWRTVIYLTVIIFLVSFFFFLVFHVQISQQRFNQLLTPVESSMKRKNRVWEVNHKKSSLNHYLNIFCLRWNTRIFVILIIAAMLIIVSGMCKCFVSKDNSGANMWQLSYFTQPFIM